MSLTLFAPFCQQNNDRINFFKLFLYEVTNILTYKAETDTIRRWYPFSFAFSNSSLHLVYLWAQEWIRGGNNNTIKLALPWQPVCFELHEKGKPTKKRFNHRNELLFGTSVFLAAFPLEGRKYQQIKKLCTSCAIRRDGLNNSNGSQTTRKNYSKRMSLRKNW